MLDTFPMATPDHRAALHACHNRAGRVGVVLPPVSLACKPERPRKQRRVQQSVSGRTLGTGRHLAAKCTSRSRNPTGNPWPRTKQFRSELTGRWRGDRPTAARTGRSPGRQSKEFRHRSPEVPSTPDLENSPTGPDQAHSKATTVVVSPDAAGRRHGTGSRKNVLLFRLRREIARIRNSPARSRKPRQY